MDKINWIRWLKKIGAMGLSFSSLALSLFLPSIAKKFYCFLTFSLLTSKECFQLTKKQKCLPMKRSKYYHTAIDVRNRQTNFRQNFVSPSFASCFLKSTLQLSQPYLIWQVQEYCRRCVWNVLYIHSLLLWAAKSSLVYFKQQSFRM